MWSLPVYSDGTLEVLGRRDDQVKIRGYRVEPAEVAAALQGLRQVAAAAVAVAEHPTRGPVLVAHIAPADGGVDETKLRALLAERLPAPMLPARILLRSEEHTSELQSLMRSSSAVLCLKKQTKTHRY